MKNFLTLSLFWFAFGGSLWAINIDSANTIILKSHQNVVIKNDPDIENTYYPSWVKFPSVDTNYYKVWAYLTFECPDGEDCNQWDYLDYIKLGRLGGVDGDSLGWEIGRFITPYGGYWKSGSKWKHGWYYDFTDFAPYLHDSVEIIYVHTGYYVTSGSNPSTGGWKINLTFYITPGTPPLSVHKLTPLWTGSYKYGQDAAKKIEPITVTLGDSTKTANVKIIQTGHGMDSPGNCSEFCKKLRTVKWDQKVVDNRYMWRLCGFNSLFPQAGTWVYDRGNWCPGAEVKPDNIYVQNLTEKTNHTVDLIMESYTATSQNSGNWTLSSYLVEYGTPNYATDVAVEEIIAPSTEYDNLRVNPICACPIIVIKNNGSQILKSLDILFGEKGTSLKTYKWTGNLNFTEKDTIYLNGETDWTTNTKAGIFEVQLKNPNGKTDEFEVNNTAYSSYALTSTLPPQFVIKLRTNKCPSENYYILRNLSTQEDVLVRGNFNSERTYLDTVKLKKGCYSLELYDDGTPGIDTRNNDGLDFWAHRPYEGAGSFGLLNINGTAIGNFNADFGTKSMYRFRVLEDYVGAVEPKQSNYLFNVLPNPASGHINIEYDFKSAINKGYVIIRDVTGKTIKTINLSEQSGNKNVDVSAFAKGTYFFTLTSAEGSITQKQILR